MKTTLHRQDFATKLGPLMAVSSGKGLCALEFMEKDRMILLANRLRQKHTSFEYEDRLDAPLDAAGKWIADYFLGLFPSPAMVPLDLIGTQFEQSVWNALLEIPLGKVATYGEVGRSFACTSARAVGNAVGSNPLSIVVPCHRVIGANGTLTGYGGGLERKRWLLEHEGFSVAGTKRTSRVERRVAVPAGRTATGMQAAIK